MTHGTGYVHEAPTPGQLLDSTRRSFRVPRSFLPTKHGRQNDRFRDPFEQNSTNTCVGMLASKASSITLERDGFGIVKLSAFDPYLRGKLRRTRRLADLKDNGMRVSDAIWSIRKHGVAPEDLWPSWSYGRAKQKLNVLRWPERRNRIAFESLRLDVKFRRIVASGDRLSQRIAHSLELDQVVGISIPVGREFRRGDSILGAEPSGDWHMVCVLDWRLTSARDLEFLIGNSWGSDWGNNGRQWASSLFVEQARSVWYVEKARLL